MKLIILSRDGVINQGSDNFIRSPDDWQPIEGSLSAIGRLCQAGFSVVIATNQSGVSRGLFGVDTLNAVHGKMQALLEQYGGRIDSMFFCPHGPTEHCNCRKPKDGLLQDIKQRYQIELDDVFFVGDSLRDVQAAIKAGAKPALVKTGKGEKTINELKNQELLDVPVFDDLASIADALITENSK